MSATGSIEAILNHVGIQLKESECAMEQVQALEADFDFRVPMAFRQILGSILWPEILSQNSNGDRPILLKEMGEARWPSYRAIDEGYLPFMVENQGVCTWALQLNGAMDPPVVVEVDSGAPPNWQPCAESFSQWLEAQLWDHQQSFVFSGQLPAISTDTLASLRRLLTERSPTHAWPRTHIYRFESKLGRVLIWSDLESSDWFVFPNERAVALQFLDSLASIVPEFERIYSLSDEAETLLKNWKSRR